MSLKHSHQENWDRLTPTQRLVASVFQNAAAEKMKIHVSTADNMLKFYDDTSGQRECYITPYGPGPDGVPDMWPLHFTIKRKLSFTNKGDEGKQGAVLAVLCLHPDRFTATTHLKIEAKRLEIGSLVIHFDKPVF